MSDRAILPALLALGMLAGCAGQSRPAPAPAPAPGAPVAEGAVQDHLARLEEKIARLEQSATSASSTGKGALRSGSSLRVEGTGGETVLERLRRLERERAEQEARLGERERRLTDLERELGTARNHGRTMEEKADYLARVQESLVAAQQTLAERQEEISGLKAGLGASELQRLRGEREYYLLAAAVLRLTSERPAELAEVQERLRDQAKELAARSGEKSDKGGAGGHR
ncbi:MAG: hypothetical protein L6R48_15580 [Planctomycetes bacterium]|nr:hypothetical protein [Planctomycetota bacterium]